MLSTWVTYVNIYHTHTTCTNGYNIYTVNWKKTLEDLNLSLPLWAMKIGVGPLDSTALSDGPGPCWWPVFGQVVCWRDIAGGRVFPSYIWVCALLSSAAFLAAPACSLVFSSTPGCFSMLSCLQHHSWLLQHALLSSAALLAALSLGSGSIGQITPLLVFCSLSPSSHSLGGFSSSESSRSCHAHHQGC